MEDLSFSADLFHSDEVLSNHVRNACSAARELGIAEGLITVTASDEETSSGVVGQLPPGGSTVMHRGRAAEKLIERLPLMNWESFTECPYEDLREPGRVHIGPIGYVQICPGTAIGNVFRNSLAEIARDYEPDSHPIAGPLLAGGPAELVRRYDLPHERGYVDTCHLCYRAQLALRDRFPEILAPDQMYGVVGLGE